MFHPASPPTAVTGPSFHLTRRGVLAASGGFALALALAPGRGGADSVGAIPTTPGGDVEPRLFVEIRVDNTVALTCHRSEMGQQVWTSIAQCLAEELEVEWDAIEVVQAEGHPRYGDQNTDGSRSIRWNMLRLREMGAAMRRMLQEAAAEAWGVTPGDVTAERGVLTAGERRATYGEMAAAADARALPALDELPLKDRADWRLIGQPVPSLTVPLIVRGAGTFGQDVRLDGMAYAVVARPPQVGGDVGEIDDADALAVPGVIATHRMPAPTGAAGFQPLGGVAVIAEDTWSAIQGREALRVAWEAGPNASYDTERFTEAMLATARAPGAVRRDRGDVDAALAAAATRLEADYTAAHLAQAPMEPPAATARWSEDGATVEVWACVQAPQATRSTVAQVCGVPEDAVTIHVTWLGGGFGRKSKPDFAAEAALLAREAGRPLKVVWTREDDLRHGYYHAISAQHMEAGLDGDGNATAFLHRTVFPPIPSTFAEGVATPSWGELRLGASDTPFATPNLRLETGDAPAHLRIGWLRSVCNVFHAFAVGSFADEMAHAAGRDPRDYLLDLIGPDRLIDPRDDGVAEYDNYGSPIEDYPIDTARMKHVIREVTDMAGWGRDLGPGGGLGLAMHRSFCTYCATVVEARVDEDGRLSLPNVWAVLDAGTVVNPRHATAQLEGGTIYGLSNALYGAITSREGAVEQYNFPDFRVMRMNEAPRAVHTRIVDSDAPPGGVGEPPTPPAAPALANAIFAATGTRIRDLPVFDTNRRDRLTFAERS